MSFQLFAPSERQRCALASLLMATAAAFGLIAFFHFVGVVQVQFRAVQWAFVVAAVALLVSPGDSWVNQLERFLESQKPRWILFAIGLSCCAFSFSKVLQHYSFNTTAYDLTMFHHAVENTLHGRFLFAFGIERNFFSEHFSPILLGWVALYSLAPFVETLLLIQSLSVALAGVPLYWLARKSGLLRLEACILTLAFWCNPILWRAFGFDVHVELMAPLFLLAMAAFCVARKWVWFYVFAVLSLSVKEDVPVIVGGWALWMFWRQRADWKHGVALSILSIVWLVAALKWAIPSAAGGQQSHFLQDRYGHLGATYSDVAWKLFTEPHLVLDMLMGRPVRSWFGHLGPAAWVEPVAIVAALPNILLNRATHYGPQQVLAFYYALPATLSLLLTIPPTIARLGRRFGRTTAVTLALLSNFPATEDVVPPPLQWPQRDDFAAHSALARLDVSSDVVAQTTALPHLSVSSTLRLFEGPVTGEWLVLTPRKLAWPMSRKSVVEALRQAIRSGQYGAIFVNTSVVILRRGAPGPLDVQALEEADAAQALE